MIVGTASRMCSRDVGRKLCSGLKMEMSGYGHLDRRLTRATEFSELPMLRHYSSDSEAAVKSR